MKRLCVIPARAGSKRIPKKNIKDFCGKPIIAYSIQVARDSGLFEQIIVSTDSHEIAKIANQYGAETPFLRPAELADDHSSTTDTVRHAYNWFVEQGQQFEQICCLYPTAPLVSVTDLRQGADNLNQADCLTSFAATQFRFPIQRAVMLDGRGVKPFDKKAISMRSQDLEEAYHDAGQFYWWRANSVNDRNAAMFAATSSPVILPSYRVQDIDTDEDWRMAEFLYKAQKKGVFSK